MQKYRLFFFSNLIILFLIISFSIQLFGQSNSELANLYENNQLVKLKQYSDNDQINDPHWRVFVKTLFEQNADSALGIFAAIYRLTQDKVLQQFIIERISDYYYARGYYKTAERLLKDKKYFNETISAQHKLKTETKNFGIQIGAFSSYENALSLKNKVLKRADNVAIINKDSNDENLYVVVVGKFSDRKAAERELQVLKQKNINGFIVTY
jgi:hypothetical protein